jgi:uncharacterized protein (TIGR02145 family)
MFAPMVMVPVRAVAVAMSLAFGAIGAAQQPPASPQSKRMPDGKLWMTENLNVRAEASYCYDDSAQNCRRYGRLYTWESAQRACRALDAGWRLPTDEEWRQLGKHFGGIRQESADLGKAAHTALITGGPSGFNAVYGGGRTGTNGEYERLEAHGLYWSSTESGPDRVWIYNFGKGGQSVGRHENGQKLWAISVRCVRE